MNVVFISHYFAPHIGGVEKHVAKISRELINQGHSITVITKKNNPSLPESETINKIKVLRISFPNIKILGLIIAWVKILKHTLLIKNTDIVHIHDVMIWYLPFKILLPRKPVFLTFHGWEGEYPIPYKNILLKKIASKLSTRSIAIGEYISKYYGINATVISYGATDTPKIKLNKKSKTILYLGRLEKDTGLPTFLEAAVNLKNYSIEFCGDGSLRKDCEKVGTVHGFTKPNKYLAESEYCVASGYLSVLEALSHKCKVITIYDNPLKKDYFKLSPFASDMLLCKNSNEILSKINTEKLNTNKSHLVEKKYSWKNLTNTYIELWSQ